MNDNGSDGRGSEPWVPMEPHVVRTFCEVVLPPVAEGAGPLGGCKNMSGGALHFVNGLW